MRRRFFIIIIIFLLSVTYVFADSLGTINIEGQHRVENNEQLKTGRHTFVLTATDGAPMPEGSKNGVKEVTISSGEKFSFGDIVYEEPGTFEYTVSRKLIKSKELIEDDSVYKAKVTVSGDGTCVIVFDKIGTSGKPNKIEYVDQYVEPEEEPEEEPEDVKTGDDTDIIPYMSLIGVSLTGLYISLRLKRQK